MEFQGRIKTVLPMRSGVSQRTGNEWKSQPFVFEYFENPSDRYSDRVMLETFDANIIPNIKENAEVRIGFGHRVREYDGRVYNEVTMYKFELVGAINDAGQAQQPSAQTSAPKTQTAEQPGEGEEDDLPF